MATETARVSRVEQDRRKREGKWRAENIALAREFLTKAERLGVEPPAPVVNDRIQAHFSGVPGGHYIIGYPISGTSLGETQIFLIPEGAVHQRVLDSGEISFSQLLRPAWDALFSRMSRQRGPEPAHWLRSIDIMGDGEGDGA